LRLSVHATASSKRALLKWYAWELVAALHILKAPLELVQTNLRPEGFPWSAWVAQALQHFLSETSLRKHSELTCLLPTRHHFSYPSFFRSFGLCELFALESQVSQLPLHLSAQALASYPSRSRSLTHLSPKGFSCLACDVKSTKLTLSPSGP